MLFLYLFAVPSSLLCFGQVIVISLLVNSKAPFLSQSLLFCSSSIHPLDYLLGDIPEVYTRPFLCVQQP